MKKKYYIYKLNLIHLNILSILIFIITIILTLLINKDLMLETLSIDNIFVLIFVFLLYTILHELLHGSSYIMHGAKKDNITYGCALEKGILYCLCKQNITRNNILKSLIYPFVFIGIFTYILSLVFYSKTLLLLSLFNIAGCAGDLIMFAFILKLDKNIEFSEFDDEISFGIYSGKDISKKKCFGLKYTEKKDKLSRKDKKKIKISKFSIPILIAIVILVIIDLFI